MKMQIKGILFDFDGTIANTIDLIIATFEHTCREVLGFTPEREKIVATFGRCRRRRLRFPVSRGWWKICATLTENIITRITMI